MAWERVQGQTKGWPWGCKERAAEVELTSLSPIQGGRKGAEFPASGPGMGQGHP